MKITAARHPYLFAVCASILLDNGAVNRAEPMPVAVLLPNDDTGFDMVTMYEWMLERMTDEERETFANGEVTEAQTVTTRYGLGGLSRVLNAWFEEGMPCERLTGPDRRRNHRPR